MLIYGTMTGKYKQGRHEKALFVCFCYCSTEMDLNLGCIFLKEHGANVLKFELIALVRFGFLLLISD